MGTTFKYTPPLAKVRVCAHVLWQVNRAPSLYLGNKQPTQSVTHWREAPFNVNSHRASLLLLSPLFFDLPVLPSCCTTLCLSFTLNSSASGILDFPQFLVTLLNSCCTATCRTECNASPCQPLFSIHFTSASLMSLSPFSSSHPETKMHIIHMITCFLLRNANGIGLFINRIKG